VVWLATGLGVALRAAAFAAVCLGRAGLSLGEVWAALTHPRWAGEIGGRDSGTGTGTEPGQVTQAVHAIVWQIRLPRVLTAAAVGAGLALSGAVMQALTRNPLADPYLLGVSSGASLGAVLVLLAGLTVLLPVAAFAGALGAMLLALALAGAVGSLTPGRTILAGLAVSQACAAAVSLVIFTTARGDAFREVLAWLMGSLAGATWTSVWVTAGALVLLGPWLIRLGGTLDAFAFGDQTAAALGVRVGRTRRWTMVAVAVLTGAMVSQSGSIGFVGLVVPHIVRLGVGALNRRLLALTGLMGALFLLVADTLARLVIAPGELPVGVVTAAVGAPVFAVVLLRLGRPARQGGAL
jgi:iron complex transport system permease protein